MPIPDYQSIMLPLLRTLEDGKEHHIRQVIEELALQFKLTEEERKELLPSGLESVLFIPLIVSPLFRMIVSPL